MNLETVLAGLRRLVHYDRKVTIDFETRSVIPIDRGPWIYAQHPSTEVLCLAYKIGDAPTKLWHARIETSDGHVLEEMPPPEDLLEAVEDGWLVEAHNAFFELCVWFRQMFLRRGWPMLTAEQRRCSAAKAAYYGLPRKLEQCVKALHLPVEKDSEGHKLMLRLCKPRPMSKVERREALQQGVDPDDLDAVWRAGLTRWYGTKAEFERLFEYCTRDVDAEYYFSETLDDLPQDELDIWLVDQIMNMRGVRCDVPMARAAVRMRDNEIELLNAELRDITSGVVEKGSARASFKDWYNDQTPPEPLENTQGKTFDKVLAIPDGHPKRPRPDLRASLKIVQEVNRSSTAKYTTLLDMADPLDHRLRDMMMYHGASTGRWSGKGFQPHNLVRGNIKDMDLACKVILEEDPELIRVLYGEVMEHLAFCMRGELIPSEDMELWVADYSAIEARVVMWLARQMDALKIFTDESAGLGHGIYCDMASGIYGREVTKKDKDERQFGKQAILGLGFEMGFVTFLLTCKKYDISFSREQVLSIMTLREYKQLEKAVEKYFLTDKRRIMRMREANLSIRGHMHELVLMLFTVNKYRDRYPEVRQMWRDQEAAALNAVRYPGEVFECERGRNYWICEDVGGTQCLKTYLPSGKPLFYWEPLIVSRKTPFKNPDGSPVYKDVLTFMGVHPKTHKWTRLDTYGGKLTENITQAVARELMARAMVRVERSGKYRLLLSVHDEVISEALKNKGSKEEYSRLMSDCANDNWVDGCPVEAETMPPLRRYKK